MADTKVIRWLGSPIKNWTNTKLRYWLLSFSLLNRRPKDWAVTLLEPGTGDNIEVKLAPLTIEVSWEDKDERWFNRLTKTLRGLYPRHGQGDKRFGERRLKEWVFYINSAPTSLDESGKIIEDIEETSRRIEEFWQAYGIEHGFSRGSQRAFKKALAYYGICINYVGSSRGQYEWNRMHPTIQDDDTQKLEVCSRCGNNNSNQIKTNEFGVHQCLICSKVWPR